jgi:hypothetical protein
MLLLSFRRSILFAISLAFLFVASYSEASSIYSCSDTRCVVRLKEGLVGDSVKILDDKARTVAAGRIIKRKGSFGVVALSYSNQIIRRNYPVIVNLEKRASSMSWAASFSGFD